MNPLKDYSFCREKVKQVEELSEEESRLHNVNLEAEKELALIKIGLKEVSE